MPKQSSLVVEKRDALRWEIFRMAILAEHFGTENVELESQRIFVFLCASLLPQDRSLWHAVRLNEIKYEHVP